MIDFAIPKELEEIRGRVAAFVRDEVEPVEAELPSGRVPDRDLEGTIAALRDRARAAGVYLPQLPAEFGGLGLGPLAMALIQEVCGPSLLAASALNCMAPDEGTMDILHRAGTPEQKERYLRPLAEGKVRSCFAMTEKGVAGSDPTTIRTTATRDGDGWVLDGEKWFISGAQGAAFGLVVAVTHPEAAPHERCSILVVDADTPGWEVVRDIPTMGTHLPGGHCEVRLESCRVPAGALLGPPGAGFRVAQERLGTGRLGHAMRWIGIAQRALDMAVARARGREAFGVPLAGHEGVTFPLADSAIELHAARLMVLHAAWKLESGQEARREVAMIKVFVSEALGRIVDRALQIHGSLGYATVLPLERWYRDARAARIYDGPSEVHRMTIARSLLKQQ